MWQMSWEGNATGAVLVTRDFPVAGDVVVTRPDLCRQAALQADVAFASLDLEDTNVTDVKLPGFTDFQTANLVLVTISVLSAHFAVQETANVNAEQTSKDRNAMNAGLATMTSQDAKNAAVIQRESSSYLEKEIAVDPRMIHTVGVKIT